MERRELLSFQLQGSKSLYWSFLSRILFGKCFFQSKNDFRQSKICFELLVRNVLKWWKLYLLWQLQEKVIIVCIENLPPFFFRKLWLVLFSRLLTLSGILLVERRLNLFTAPEFWIYDRRHPPSYENLQQSA